MFIVLISMFFVATEEMVETTIKGIEITSDKNERFTSTRSEKTINEFINFYNINRLLSHLSKLPKIFDNFMNVIEYPIL